MWIVTIDIPLLAPPPLIDSCTYSALYRDIEENGSRRLALSETVTDCSVSRRRETRMTS